jgi:glyoxylase-like metal-dependent hydrolase (beta-lactamase superfamily II)
MPAFICTACGTEFPPSAAPPAECPVCQEERQYVPPAGQTWTTVEDLAKGHRNAFHEHEPGLTGIGTEPSFAIGQRAILIQTPRGNVLWDCIALIDEATVERIRGLGGIAAIAISHPHFYTTMNRWSAAFGGAPIYVHEDDRDWIRQPDPAIRSWSGGTMKLLPDVTLIRCGGHYPGSAVLHWSKGADGAGIVCSGDTLTVTTDRKFLTFMRSYPNLIPLPPKAIRKISAAMESFAFERIYGHYSDRVITEDAKAVFDRSIARYLAAITD